MIATRIPFMSLVPAKDGDADAIRGAIDRVIARGWFVLGPEVEAFEHEFAEAVRLEPSDAEAKRYLQVARAKILGNAEREAHEK